jgi:hypothetical protein
VVAIENAPGAMPSYLHGHSLGYSAIDHVPDRCAAAVVPEGTRDARRLQAVTHALRKSAFTVPIRRRLM